MSSIWVGFRLFREPAEATMLLLSSSVHEFKVTFYLSWNSFSFADRSAYSSSWISFFLSSWVFSLPFWSNQGSLSRCARRCLVDSLRSDDCLTETLLYRILSGQTAIQLSSMHLQRLVKNVHQPIFLEPIIQLLNSSGPIHCPSTICEIRHTRCFTNAISFELII